MVIVYANSDRKILRYLLQWMSNDIDRVLMVLSIIMNLVVSVYSLMLHVAIRKTNQHS